MSGFLNPLRVEELPDGIHWRTLEPIEYDVGREGGPVKIIVPAGTITDFGSVPQVLHSLISPIGRAKRAYVVHDYLYQEQVVSRALSDLILYEALKVLGLPLWHRRAVYRGVRLGGWVAWRGHRKRRELALKG